MGRIRNDMANEKEWGKRSSILQQHQQSHAIKSNKNQQCKNLSLAQHILNAKELNRINFAAQKKNPHGDGY